jgi:predicted transcriptional regulator
MGSVSEKLRRRVYDLVLESPGLTIGGIAKVLGRGETATKTALNWLERNECVVLASDPKDRRRRWYKAIAPYPLSDAEKLAAIREIVGALNGDEAVVKIKEVLG